MTTVGHSDAIRAALSRHDGGNEIVEHADALTRFLNSSACSPAPMLPLDERTIILDLSRGSEDLGEPLTGLTVEQMSHLIEQRMDDVGTRFAFGRWGERRELYVSDLFVVNAALPMRDVHLGVDVFCASGSLIHAPLAGHVHVCANNARDLDYGPLIILRHDTPCGSPFFSLYGHLELSSVSRWEVGQPVAAGTPLAAVGAPPENGNWPPHLHFQLILNLLGEGRDFPGVALYEERAAWLALSPLPTRFFPETYAHGLDGSDRGASPDEKR
ncbi:MAG: peptidoglycan DD-metalloendopeptidase family protein [Pseudomonadota bacterium]